MTPRTAITASLAREIAILIYDEDVPHSHMILEENVMKCKKCKKLKSKEWYCGQCVAGMMEVIVKTNKFVTDMDEKVKENGNI